MFFFQTEKSGQFKGWWMLWIDWFLLGHWCPFWGSSFESNRRFLKDLFGKDQNQDLCSWYPAMKRGASHVFFCNKQLTSKFKNLRLLKDASTKRSFCNHPNHLHYTKIHDVVGWTCSCDLKDASRLQLFSCCPDFLQISWILSNTIFGKFEGGSTSHQ